MQGRYFCILLLFLSFTLFSQTSIDYSKGENWSALPFRLDAGDQSPKQLPLVSDSLKNVDVFFVYPTSFEKGDAWNAEIDDAALNKETDEKSIKNQASVFNASCRVFAPRYRQANIKAFYTIDTIAAAAAFELAYQDVKAAFLYYLAHYNQGRPFIIASHSQGTLHTRKLLQELIDGKPIAKQMVAAYLIGYPVRTDMYQFLKPCSNPDQIGCYEAWYSFRKDFTPDNIHTFYKNAVCVNPITWRMDTVSSSFDQHLGMILLNFNKIQAKSVSVQIHDHILWADIESPLAKHFTNLHIADYNLYWADIRKHVADQVRMFMKK